jgi:acyl-CoA thioester hydrolase
MADTTTGYFCDVPLRWSDMDAYGHVNNVQMLRLLEDARVRGLEDWFGPGNRVLADGILVARHEIEYLAPLTFRHAPVRVDVVVTDVEAAGFRLGYVVRDPDDVGSTRYAVAATRLVTYDFAAAAPARLAPQLRTALRDRAAADAGRAPAFRWAR